MVASGPKLILPPSSTEALFQKTAKLPRIELVDPGTGETEAPDTADPGAAAPETPDTQPSSGETQQPGDPGTGGGETAPAPDEGFVIVS